MDSQGGRWLGLERDRCWGAWGRRSYFPSSPGPVTYPAPTRDTGSTGQRAGTSARAEIFSQENFRRTGSTAALAGTSARSGFSAGGKSAENSERPEVPVKTPVVPLQSEKLNACF